MESTHVSKSPPLSLVCRWLKFPTCMPLKRPCRAARDVNLCSVSYRAAYEAVSMLSLGLLTCLPPLLIAGVINQLPQCSMPRRCQTSFQATRALKSNKVSAVVVCHCPSVEADFLHSLFHTTAAALAHSFLHTLARAARGDLPQPHSSMPHSFTLMLQVAATCMDVLSVPP